MRGDALAEGAAAIVAEREAPFAGAPFVRVADARAALARAAARLFPRQPETIVAVTGTSGKTSVAAFTRQIWASLGREAASLGTIGVVSRPLTVYGSLTTPDPIALHQTLDGLADAGVTHLAMEASSHGLDQKRLDGVRLAAGAFTNLSRDHMDYHATVEDYLAAKLRLFRELLPAARRRSSTPTATSRRASSRRRANAACRCFRSAPRARRSASPRSRATVSPRRSNSSSAGVAGASTLPLPGDFQVSNALVAAGLCIATGGEADAVFKALQSLEGAPGRLERIGEIRGAAVFVDYAHKPDALEKALAALRPYVRGRLILVFGCGGDRDAGKRPIMGEIATRCADVAIVTDDNPRSENPAAIRAQILAAAPGALEIGDRAEAIRAGVAMLTEGDALLIAGKGHEIGQIVGDKDAAVQRRRRSARGFAGGGMSALWAEWELTTAFGAAPSAPLNRAVAGVSIDTRTLAPGDLFFAIKGETHDGHDHASRAFEAGASAAVVSRERADALAAFGPVFAVDDTLKRDGAARRRLARADEGAHRRGDRLGRQDERQGDAARRCSRPAARTHASAASYNNHWGVPLTLARMPAGADFGVFEIGMNHAGEIAPLVQMVRPHVALITTIAPVHIEHLGSIEAIADAKAEIFSGSSRAGRRSSIATRRNSRGSRRPLRRAASAC